MVVWENTVSVLPDGASIQVFDSESYEAHRREVRGPQVLVDDTYFDVWDKEHRQYSILLRNPGIRDVEATSNGESLKVRRQESGECGKPTLFIVDCEPGMNDVDLQIRGFAVSDDCRVTVHMAYGMTDREERLAFHDRYVSYTRFVEDHTPACRVYPGSQFVDVYHEWLADTHQMKVELYHPVASRMVHLKTVESTDRDLGIVTIAYLARGEYSLLLSQYDGAGKLLFKSNWRGVRLCADHERCYGPYGGEGRHDWP